MAQSLARLHTHIVFSTKNREPFISEAIAHATYGLIGSVCHEMASPPIAVGGWMDHVHILCAVSRTVAVMDLVKEVKIHSSLWFKDQPGGNSQFYWQGGYAAFSVSPSNSGAVAAYINNQKLHHQRISYQEECRLLLREQGIEIDERYFWD